MRRAALLLEVILALALFTTTALMLLAIIGRSLDALEEARHRQTACDLARSAMSRIEAGFASPESLNGPAQLYEQPLNAPGDDLPAESEWELSVQTEPSQFDGLTLITITARRTTTPLAGDEDGPGGGEFTLRQLVKLRDSGAAVAGGAARPGGGL